MIRRTLIICAVMLAATCLLTGVAPPARGASANAEMRAAIMTVRGLIDRRGAERYYTYPTTSSVRAGHLTSGWWPSDPWTGRRLSPGTTRGHYQYRVTKNRRRYRLVGYLDGGRVVVSGGMPRSIKLAYDHRGEEGINLIRQYIEDYAALHNSLYPPASEVSSDGDVGTQPRHRYWPSNPWDHLNMTQRGDRGSFSYTVTSDRQSYTLRLHRALKPDYVLRGSTASGAWQQLLITLDDEILDRNGRILAGYVDQWSLQHSGALPTVNELIPTGAAGAAHTDWPNDPISGTDMQPGTSSGTYTYAPGTDGAYTLTVHLCSGDVDVGGIATVLSAATRNAAVPDL